MKSNIGKGVIIFISSILCLIFALPIVFAEADKTELIEHNQQAMIAYYEEREKYTEASHALFREAVLAYGAYQTVQQLIDDINATQEAIDTMNEAIVNALNLLVLRADTGPLKTALFNLESLDLSSYTPDSILIFNAEKERLEIIASSLDTTDDLLQAAWNDYNLITDLLVELADRSSLIALIETHKDTIEKGSNYYTKTSFGYLQIVLSEATNVLNNPNATPEEIIQIELKFSTAIGLLEYPYKEVVIVEDTHSINLSDYVVVGDSTIIGYSTEDPSIIEINEYGNVKGLRYGHTTARILLENGLYEEVPIIVKAKLSLTTFLMVLSLPVVSIGLIFILLSNNTKNAKLLKNHKNKN